MARGEVQIVTTEAMQEQVVALRQEQDELFGNIDLPKRVEALKRQVAELERTERDLISGCENKRAKLKGSMVASVEREIAHQIEKREDLYDEVKELSFTTEQLERNKVALIELTEGLTVKAAKAQEDINEREASFEEEVLEGREMLVAALAKASSVKAEYEGKLTAIEEREKKLKGEESDLIATKGQLEVDRAEAEEGMRLALGAKGKAETELLSLQGEVRATRTQLEELRTGVLDKQRSALAESTTKSEAVLAGIEKRGQEVGAGERRLKDGVNDLNASWVLCEDKRKELEARERCIDAEERRLKIGRHQ